MKKNLIYLVHSLEYFISHRVAIALKAKDCGYRITVIYGELGNNVNTKSLSKSGIKCIYLPIDRGGFSILKDFRSFIYILYYFIKFKPDLVHLVSIKPYLYGGIAARIAGVPAAVSAITGLGTLFDKKLKYRLLRIIFYPLFKFAFSHANQIIIVQNHDNLNRLVSWGVAKKKFFYLICGSGTNLSKFKNLIEPSRAITICFCGRLLHDKGVFDFINAAKIIKKRAIKTKFLLAGNLDPKNISSLSKKELKNIKKEKIVDVVGYQRDIPRLFARSNIICLPSYGEGLPKVLIEAAAASRAVVTTAIPGCRDAIIANKTGLLVPVKNPKKLADAFEYLIKHPARRLTMGKAGRKLAEKKFSIERVVKAHISIYQKLIKATNKKTNRV